MTLPAMSVMLIFNGPGFGVAIDICNVDCTGFGIRLISKPLALF